MASNRRVLVTGSVGLFAALVVSVGINSAFMPGSHSTAPFIGGSDRVAEEASMRSDARPAETEARFYDVRLPALGVREGFPHPAALCLSQPLVDEALCSDGRSILVGQRPRERKSGTNRVAYAEDEHTRYVDRLEWASSGARKTNIPGRTPP